MLTETELRLIVRKYVAAETVAGTCSSAKQTADVFPLPSRSNFLQCGESEEDRGTECMNMP